MDSYSSGEEPVVKTRKPYTITKQRERWTEVEHSMFLEALKLYGRAWQRIEEHIGSKTAVQIRSHAQKFFTKLEKEALIKGVPIGQALDIEIPPPRPKRKPINPYPRSRKTASCNLVAKDGKLSAADSSLCQNKQPPCQDKEPLMEKPSDDEKLDIANENREDVISDMLTLFQAGSTSPSVGNRDSVPSEVITTFRGFVPIVNGGGSIQDDGNRSYVTIEATNKLNTKQSFQDGSSCSSPCMGNSVELEEKLGYGERLAEPNQPGGIIRENDMRRYPRHVPVHILEESSWINTNNRHHTLSNTSQHQSDPSMHSTHHVFPNFHPMVTSDCNSNHYRSCLHISSAFSSLIVSALLQNPAAHAAASFAASSLWPCSNMEAPADSALAAVTVAAATAWWAANGLLPICSPFHNTSFTYPTPSATNMPMSTCDTKVGNSERKDETPDHLHAQEQVTGSLEQAARVTALVGSNTEEKNRKLVDRSSCGSNTPSSSEIETDALENIDKDKQDPYHINHTPTDSGNRRGKSNSNINDPWKEVSEEGRIAFQALFSREVLPQSFSRPHDSNSTAKVYSEQNGLHLDLSDKSSLARPIHSGNMGEAPFGGEESTLALKLGEAKLKARHTGFKPYKRCSVEARDSRVTSTSYHHLLLHQDDEEKVSKRLRLGGGESST
ncbi:hypothetical protein DM860_018226 [Cuscuta australis]|uniref:Uncharacterized protein n=1 Tax=Cuscuta australis TaxID=267555 RepID=A0A328DDK4_9ASTE|nr:hypothetical protein DM860_018226 [Cuscuta australis]